MDVWKLLAEYIRRIYLRHLTPSEIAFHVEAFVMAYKRLGEGENIDG